MDRVEWRAIADHQTAINALLGGEIDVIESPLHDLLPVLKKDTNVKLADINAQRDLYERSRHAEADLLVKSAEASGTELINRAMEGAGSDKLLKLPVRMLSIIIYGGPIDT